MAPLLFRGMKGVNISCASPASTATCTSMDLRRSVAGCHSTATARGTDRLQVPHLRDGRRARLLKNWVLPPSPSKLKSYAQKSRKSADVPGSLVSPTPSSRYPLNDDDDADAFFDVLFSDLDPLPVLIPINSSRFQSVVWGDESPALRPSSSLSTSSFAAAASRDLQVCFRVLLSSSSSAPPSQAANCDGSVPLLGPSDSTMYGKHPRAAAAAALPSAGVPLDASSPVPDPSPSRRSQSQAFLIRSSSLSETRFQYTTKGPNPKAATELIKIEGVMDAILQHLKKGEEEIVTEVTWVIVYLSALSQIATSMLVKSDAVQLLVEWLEASENLQLLILALRSLGNLVAGDGHMTNFVLVVGHEITNKVLLAVIKCMKTEHRVLKKEKWLKEENLQQMYQFFECCNLELLMKCDMKTIDEEVGGVDQCCLWQQHPL